MGQGIGDKNIITMLLIFLAAGTFVGVVGRSSAESVAYFMLSWIPAKYAVAVLFVVACFVSTAMGTSVGTITLLVPIASAVAETSGFSLALCVASVMGGSMFGDNLSFISDTTIAACNGQGCEMKDKFRENFWIALPAALAALALILVNLLPTGAGHTDRPRIPSAADGSVPARADRRHRGHSGVCRTPYRYCFRCRYHARYGTDDALGYALQHGKRHFGYV